MSWSCLPSVDSTALVEGIRYLFGEFIPEHDVDAFLEALQDRVCVRCGGCCG